MKETVQSQFHLTNEFSFKNFFQFSSFIFSEQWLETLRWVKITHFQECSISLTNMLIQVSTFNKIIIINRSPICFLYDFFYKDTLKILYIII